MTQVIGIKYSDTGQTAYVETTEAFELDSQVLIQKGKGTHLAQTTSLVKDVSDNYLPSELGRVLRPANHRDLQAAQENQDLASSSREDVEQLIAYHELGMSLVDIVFSLDRDHVLITFTADGRVDFRGLLRDLASYFRMRIELRQLNSREEAKVYGGLGPCGRPLCCSTFLGEFPPVSIKMVKNQGLSLNSGKANGLCGRLMCCLSYEDEFYRQAMANFPDVGAMVDTKEGPAEVLAIDVFANHIKVRRQGDLAPVTYDLEEVQING